MLSLLWDFIWGFIAGGIAVWAYKKMNPVKTHCPHCREPLIETTKHGINPNRREPTDNNPFTKP